MKIVVGTTLWQRPKIEELTLWRIRNLAHASKHTVRRVAVGSHVEDLTRPALRADQAGWTYFDAPNSPLGRKHQALLAGIRSWPFDALVIIGSDNWLSDGLIDAYVEVIEKLGGVQRPLTFGVRDCYFVNTADGRSVYWPGYPPGRRHGESIGAGRLYTRAALEAVDFELWPRTANFGLDRAATEKLRSVGAAASAVTQAQLGREARVIDLKSATNIWSFDRFTKAAGAKCTSTAAALSAFPKDEVAALTAAFPEMLRRGEFR